MSHLHLKKHNMQEILPYLQIIIAILLITVILLQQGGAAMGAAFGQGGDSFHNERRGSEKILFTSTVVLGVAFIVIALVTLFI